MGVKNRTKKVVKPFINVPYWMSLDEHKTTWQRLVDTAMGLLFPPMSPKHEESFEEALKRLNLTEAEVHRRQRQCLMIALLFFFAAICSGAYVFYLLFDKQFAASFLGLGVTALCFAFAFRYHFWYFQIKNRRLGATVQEWWNAKLKG